MSLLLSRREVIAGAAAMFGLVPPASAEDRNLIMQIERTLRSLEPSPAAPPEPAASAPDVADEEYFDPALLPPPESPVDFPVPHVSPSIIPSRYRAQNVEFTGPEQRGTVVVDPETDWRVYANDDRPTGDTNSDGVVDLAFEDVPRIPLFQPYSNVAMQKNVDGYAYWFHRRLDYRAMSKG